VKFSQFLISVHAGL